MLSEVALTPPAAQFSRRGLFSVFPAAAGCLGCAAAVCAQGPQEPAHVHSPAEKSDFTWEQLFRFAYQKDLIPLLQQLAEQTGRTRFVEQIKTASDEVVRKKTAGRPPVVRDIATLAANLKNAPPLMQHALDAVIVEQSATAFEYRVNRCLWAKSFVDSQAGDLGYAMVCYPDYAVARSLNPKLKLIRTKTLMQGDDHCNLRYVLES